MSVPTEETASNDGRSPRARNRSSSASRERRVSAATLIIPIAVICRLAIMLPSTTNFRILEIAACRLWYYLNDPAAIPPGGIPEDMCKLSGVDRYYAAMSSVLAVGDGIGTVIGCAAAGYFGSRVGRKPVLLGVLIIAITGQISVVLSQILGSWLEFAFFFLWAICQTIGNVVTTLFVVNMYIVDVSGAEERTAALSKIAGWAALGNALSLSVGGTITTRSRSTLTVYLTSSVILLLSCIYIVAVLPESFPASKRAELRRQHEQEALLLSQSWLQKAKSSFAVITEPLELLRPSYNPATRRYNRRLLYCAIHAFIVTLADGYAVLAMILYFTTHYKYTPAETGYVLTTLNITGAVVLTTVIPVVVRYLRPLYKRKQPDTLLGEETSLDNDDSSDGSKPDEVVSETSDHLDVHITIGSWLIEATAYLGVAAMSTLPTQLAAVVCIGLGAGRSPVFRSLVAASVDPLKQGEALASIEVVSSLGLILSPILMGSITTWTITSMPQTIFYVHAIIIVLGASVLILVRDSDRYQKPRIVLEGED